jgi:hypothetical protein
MVELKTYYCKHICKMKRIFITFLFFLSLFFVSISYWEKESISDTQNQDINLKITQSWSENEIKKSNTWSENDNDTKKISEEDKAKLEKNLNFLLIESYKAKLDKIIDQLKDNIKDENKETQLKILSSVTISVNNKINIIQPMKNISKNRKEILLTILWYIKVKTEKEIKEKF